MTKSASLPSVTRQYRAFISYRHLDNREEGRRWASWLQEAMESYEVPRSLVGTINSRGERVPDSLFPVFRDEQELPVDADLSQALRQALIHSDSLVVICSPRAVESRYVSSEIEEFKKLGRADRVFALIVSGEPITGDAETTESPQQCLPLALRRGILGPAGNLDWAVPCEPICADTRIPGTSLEGFTNAAAYRAYLEKSGTHSSKEIPKLVREYANRLDSARLKVIGGVLGVSLGALTRADNRFRIERLRRALAVVGSLGAIACIAAVMAIISQQIAAKERRFAEHANVQANGLINDMLYSLGQKLKPIGKVALLEDVSVSAERYFEKLPQYRAGLEGHRNRAAAALYRGDVLEETGEQDAALAKYREAHAQLSALMSHRETATFEVRRLASLCFERLADALEDDAPADALSFANQAVTMHEALVGDAPGDLGLLSELGQNWERLGDITEDSLPDPVLAEKAFRRSAEIRQKLHESVPDNPQWQRDFGVANGRLGDLYQSQGRLEEARRHFEKGLEVRLSLTRNQALNTRWQSEISRGYDSLGQLLLRMNQSAEAAKALESSIRIRRILADFDPSNVKWQGDLLRSNVQLARLETSRGNWGAAKVILAASLPRARELADRSGADQKIVLEYLHLRLLEGMRQRAAGTPADALAELDACLKHVETLIEKSPGSAKLELLAASIAHELGECQEALGKAAESAQRFQQAVDFRTKHGGNDVDIDAELGWSEGRLAMVLIGLPDHAVEAARYLSQSRSRFARLAKAGALSPQNQVWKETLDRLALPLP